MSRRIPMVVTEDGTLRPYDEMSAAECRRRKLGVGMIVSVDLKQSRDPRAWARIHKLMQLLIQNLDDFANWDAHDALKRIQFEADIGCERMEVMVKNYGAVTQRWPKSLAFDQMEEGEFQGVYRAICQYIIDTYWAGMTVDQINDMANLVGAAA